MSKKSPNSEPTKKILVAIAWPYVNGDLHVGHLAGYLFPADVFARYHRLRGNDVLMVSGSDCHGTPTTVQADKEGVSPTEIVEKYHKRDIELFKKLQLSYNLYTKTTTENHKRVSQELFMDLLKNDFIVKGVMNQYYSPDDKKFLPDRYVEGTCPHCGAKDQRSDQCENCGRWLGEGELIDPHSRLTKAKVVMKETEHYFLDFGNSEIQKMLRKYLDTRKGIWRDWVWKEADGWLREGLKRRAITRDLDWGVELPVDEIKKLPPVKQLKSFAGKRLYVWFEAVMGYLSAPQEWAKIDPRKVSDDVIYREFPGQSRDWHDWWQNKSAEQYYFMGQDNLVFHTLMWPAELWGARKGYTMPTNVLVNKFMNLNGAKFSKSRGNIIDSREIVEKFGLDAVRYYIIANLPENKKSNFTWETFFTEVNNELVANLGNFVNRTLKFFESKFDGKLDVANKGIDKEIEEKIDGTYKKIASHLEKGEFVAALDKLLELSRFGNQYFDKEKIWEVVKSDEDKAKSIILNLLNLVRNLAILMEPFLPLSSEKLVEMLGEKRQEIEVGRDLWKAKFDKEFRLAKQVEILFQKLDKEEI